jgi:toxin ParE1/3/4
MGTVTKTATSRKDYRDIWKFIAEQGRPAAADALLLEFDAALALLGEHPLAGPLRPELGNRLSSYPVGNYVILYRPKRDGVELTRVVHGARNLQNIFKR